MNKFEKFLADDKPQRLSKGRVGHDKTIQVEHKKFTSIKVTQDIADKLSVLKSVMKEKSYSDVMNEVIDTYLNHMSSEFLEKFEMMSK